MKFLQALILLLLTFNKSLLFAQQNVGVNTTNPDPSAVMHIEATDKGVLVPRTDTATVNASFTPANGLLIYQNTDSAFYYFDGKKWRAIGNTNEQNSNTILNGIVDPTTEGMDGDFYINTATDSIFGPKASGVWPPGISLIGPPGNFGGGDARSITGNQVSNMVAGKKYMVAVYGVTANKSNNNATLLAVSVRECSGTLLASTATTVINWHDGSAPQSHTFVITAPASGCIQGFTDNGAALNMTVVQLD